MKKLVDSTLVEFEYLPEVMPGSYFMDGKSINAFYQTSNQCNNCGKVFWAHIKKGFLKSDCPHQYTKIHKFDCENCGCDTIRFYTYTSEDLCKEIKNEAYS